MPDLAGRESGKFRGFRGFEIPWPAGAAAAVIGLCLIPVLIVLGLGYAYFQFHQVPALQKSYTAAAAAVPR
jgi:chromate transporter